MATGLEHCGCCAGADVETPARIDNPPGQRAVAYRAGVHATFKESLIARLSSAELRALAGLGTREEADFTITLCDALAAELDVLSFYQERIANESYLRTATERRSILELARLIGYQLAPGVAASTHLAFTLQEVPGSPSLAAEPVSIPAGTRVQSVPGPGEQAQSFETVEAVAARVEWNAMPVLSSIPWLPRFGDTELHLAGVGSPVQPGDVILIVGRERLDFRGSERWDVRLVTEVVLDVPNQRTRLHWSAPLGHVEPHVDPAASGVAVYVFRQRAALFGHGAPDPRLMDPSRVSGLTEGTGTQLDWKFGMPPGRFDLDAAYPKITPGSWLALVSNETALDPSGLPGYVELYAAKSVSFPSRRDYGQSGKVTRIEPDTQERLSTFLRRVRESLVLAQSEILPVAATPLAYPLYGDQVELGHEANGIEPGRALAVNGKRARARLRRGERAVAIALESGAQASLEEGMSLRLAAAPEQKSGSEWEALGPRQLAERLEDPGQHVLRLTLLDPSGVRGVCQVKAAAIALAPAEESDGEVSEIAFVDDAPTAVTPGPDGATLALSKPLAHCYDRTGARVNANVAPATHGETVTEILGSGDAREPNARFALRQSPLTYVRAPTPSGRRSTLELRTNDLLWREVPSLYARRPTERVYDTLLDDEGRTTLRFGDGIEGARLPSGDHNVRARYRRGLGLAGNVAPGKLTTLLSRPLGVTGVRNPQAAGGGEDPETSDKARGNAPLTVLTLERAVSIRDYRDFARAFAGIAKAHALWIPSGPARGVFLTVAADEGAPVLEGSDTHSDLRSALQRYGNPLVPLRLASYRDARFRLRLAVQVAADAEPPRVLAAIDARLRAAFGFEARGFGQGVSVDEASALGQSVPGVVAVHVKELHRWPGGSPAFSPRLFAALPVASPDALPLAAELLTLDDAPIALDLLS